MILLRLGGITVSQSAEMRGVSEPYATKVRKGQHIPHPMHLLAVALIAGLSLNAGRTIG